MTSFSRKTALSRFSQFEFRSKMTCSNAIMQFTEFIRDKIDFKMKRRICLIELQKAFDTPDHQILWKKLEIYEYRGPIFRND